MTPWGSWPSTTGSGRKSWWGWSEFAASACLFFTVEIGIQAIMQDWANVVAYAVLLAIALVWLGVRSRRRLRRPERDD